jgi:hypothetical protein
MDLVLAAVGCGQDGTGFFAGQAREKTPISRPDIPWNARGFLTPPPRPLGRDEISP